MKTTFIYALLDPRTNAIRYVGKADDPHRRWRRHCTETGRTHRHWWIAQLCATGHKPTLRILEEVPCSEWIQREVWWIAHLRQNGCDLTNHCAGGNGAPGISPSSATREKIRAGVVRAWQENPRTMSAEHKAAFVSSRAGAIVSEETRAKIRARITGYVRSTETRQRISEAKRGKPHTPHSIETRAKLRQQKLGERNPLAKLTMEKARAIRERYAAGGVSLSALGREYGVDGKQVHRIVRGEAWCETSKEPSPA